MAVNQLAAAGFTQAYNIVDGIEGDTVDDPESVFHGKRMKNGWKNSAPWVYGVDPEKIIIEEGASHDSWPRRSVATMAAAPRGTLDQRRESRKMKRTLTRETALRTVADVMASTPTLIASLVRPKTSAALRERSCLG